VCQRCRLRCTFFFNAAWINIDIWLFPNTAWSGGVPCLRCLRLVLNLLLLCWLHYAEVWAEFEWLRFRIQSYDKLIFTLNRIFRRARYRSGNRVGIFTNTFLGNFWRNTSSTWSSSSSSIATTTTTTDTTTTTTLIIASSHNVLRSPHNIFIPIFCRLNLSIIPCMGFLQDLHSHLLQPKFVHHPLHGVLTRSSSPSAAV
jgi:hypothetical protein